MSKWILKLGIWALALIGYSLLIMNLIVFSMMGLDALSIIGCITQAMMYSVLGSEPLVYIALGFIGGSIVTYLLVKVHNKYQDRIIR